MSDFWVSAAWAGRWRGTSSRPVTASASGTARAILGDHHAAIAGSRAIGRPHEGAERFEGFLQTLGKRLANGHRFLKELSRDVEQPSEIDD